MQSTLTMLGVAVGAWLTGAATHDERFPFVALVVAVAAVVNLGLQAFFVLIRRALPSQETEDGI